MKITQLYTYPIKSLRSVPLTAATVSPHGFPYDRRFMLLKVHGHVPTPPRSKGHFDGRTENMTITYYNELALFLQSIDSSAGTFTVTYNPPEGTCKSLELPLEPDITGLENIDVSLHKSPTKAYRMSEEVNAWFSSCMGYEVILVYLGPNKRRVLGNISPSAVQQKPVESQSWLSSITSSMPDILTHRSKDEGITFADCAAYLVVTEESLNDVSSRFSDGMEVDVTKFRPNIVVAGSSKAYEEDYWGAITTSGSLQRQGKQEAEIVLTSNCLRCVSVNVDYSTGRAAKGEAGTVLKKLMKDRRVDKGNKYSPVFGRYGFSRPSAAGQTIAVGDEVTVSKINEERTTFEWPGMGS